MATGKFARQAKKTLKQTTPQAPQSIEEFFSSEEHFDTNVRISGNTDIRTKESSRGASSPTPKEPKSCDTDLYGNTVVRISGSSKSSKGHENQQQVSREPLVREEFRLSQSLSEKLRWAAFQQKTTKKEIVVAALEAYFKQTATNKAP